MIRRLAVVLVVALVTSLALSSGSPAAAAPGSYIVVLEEGVEPGVVAAEHARRYGAAVRFLYGHALRGYAGTIPDARLAAVRADGRVSYVVPDGTALAVAQALPWGVNVIDADLSPTALAGNGSGAIGNVRAYIIDTGIDTAHTDLNVIGHVNFAGGQNRDCNGHGTHVAGTVAARDNAQDVVGVAPGAPLVGVKVLGCGGSGTWSGVIKGIDYVTAQVKASGMPAIANMSLGGSPNQAVDDAVLRSATPTATYRGVFYALAAGNDGVNACDSSPARLGADTDNGIVTTAATTSSDAEASWSNFGPCVDLWAPGVGILSTRKGGGTTTMSGTSMASPHTGGAAALWLSTHTGASPATVESALKASATTTPNTSKDGVSRIVRLWVGSF